eukprot:TRINITY_DN72912_c0_g1_i1.p1 TRINITY_DN72912_c0_g1~~TRINITY_DN72912_c0_g1_i1.p1  ORF type:complete len:343 (+),score=49.45 TRINITY_DN72912_c0_g1_i1:91-1119(+)
MRRIIAAMAAVLATAGAIMLNAPSGEATTCRPETKGFVYSLQSRFAELGSGHAHCTDPSGGYCAKLASMRWIRASHLELPRNARVLFYGHSYLRQVYENILLANEKHLSYSRILKWLDWEPQNAKEKVWHRFPGCYKGHSRGRAELYEAENDPNPAMRSGAKPAASMLTYESLNTSVVTVINYPPLQNPSCMRELDRFFKFFQFDVIVYMQPHGAASDNEQTASLAGVQPVGANVTAGMDKVDWSQLALKFRRNSRFSVLVEPWTNRTTVGMGDEDIQLARNISHANMSLNDYVHVSSFANESCKEPDCRQGNGLQCQPGTLTMAAKALISKINHRLERMLR